VAATDQTNLPVILTSAFFAALNKYENMDETNSKEDGLRLLDGISIVIPELFLLCTGLENDSDYISIILAF
jgi:hypothetical protein